MSHVKVIGVVMNVLLCFFQWQWFFGSWDEDVYVPVDEDNPEGCGPVSGMNQHLLHKAENLGKCTVFVSQITGTRGRGEGLVLLHFSLTNPFLLNDKS